MDAILVPGGFGSRGVEGKIKAIEFARIHKIPYLGICLGMQLAVIEFARNIVGKLDANSTEFTSDTAYPIIAMMSEWEDRSGSVEKRSKKTDLGGTMRLGAQECKLKDGTMAANVYDNSIISERHRHRYEVNNSLIGDLTGAGLIVSGISAGKEKLVECVELDDHPWFFGCQFHPEFTSNPKTGHPLFIAYAKAALVQRKQKGTKHAS